MTKHWRIILDNKNDGYYNMALDEAILNNYETLKIPTLRIYGFDRAFISLGYKQRVSEVLIDNKMPFVRRITGGEAILHNQDLDYSIVCSVDDLDLPKSVKESYRIICLFLINFYKELNLEAKFAQKERLNNSYSNFCFSNFMPFDILIDGKKIGGNAQRRKRNIIFQQGCIPQRIDFKEIYRNIKNVSNLEDKINCLCNFTDKDFYSLEILLKDSFLNTFPVSFDYNKLTEDEINRADFLVKEKYKTTKWNYRDEKTILVR